MKKRILSILLLTALLLTVFCACGKDDGVLSAQEAQKIAIEELGFSEDDISDIHTHISEGDTPGYSIHINVGDKSYSLFVDAVTGEISPIENEEH